MVDLLGDGAHLVGHSYGGLAAIIAASERPDAVRTLALVEPPAFSVVPDDDDVQAVVDDHRALWARADELRDAGIPTLVVSGDHDLWRSI